MIAVSSFITQVDKRHHPVADFHPVASLISSHTGYFVHDTSQFTANHICWLHTNWAIGAYIFNHGRVINLITGGHIPINRQKYAGQHIHC